MMSLTGTARELLHLARALMGWDKYEGLDKEMFKGNVYEIRMHLLSCGFERRTVTGLTPEECDAFRAKYKPAELGSADVVMTGGTFASETFYRTGENEVVGLFTLGKETGKEPVKHVYMRDTAIHIGHGRRAFA